MKGSDYMGWEVPQPAVWKVEGHDNWWHSSSPIPTWRPRTRETSPISLSLSESSRTRSADIWGQEKMSAPVEAKRADLLFLHLLFSSGLSELDGAQIHQWGWLLPLSLPVQMLLSVRNTFTDIARNNILQATWASLGLVKLTQKLTITGA